MSINKLIWGNTFVLSLKNITKCYGKIKILDDINIELTNGIYGFLGENGVGKTTLFKIICGYITDHEGQVIYPRSNKNSEVLLGFLPQHFSGYPDMTIYQFLLYLGKVKINAHKKIILDDIEEKLELFNLTQIKDKKLKTLSGGQLRRVGLAQAFQLNPKIVMLDEPTTGLDPTERIRFKNYISKASQEQIILISTHIVSDLEFITKEIFILKNKKFVMSGTEESLIESCKGLVLECTFKNAHEMNKKVKKNTVSMVYESETGIRARIICGDSTELSGNLVVPTLNEVYLVNFKKEVGNNA